MYYIEPIPVTKLQELRENPQLLREFVDHESEAGMKVTAIARRLKMSRSTLYRLMGTAEPKAGEQGAA